MTISPGPRAFDRSIEQQVEDRFGSTATLVAELLIALAATGVAAVALGRDGLWIGAGAAVVAIAGFRSPTWTVGIWAALLRIDHVGWLALRVPDGWRAAAIAFVALRLRPDLRRIYSLAPWIALIGSIVVVRMGYALATHDPGARDVAFTMAAILVASALAAAGRDSIEPLLIGISAGATASASLALVQMTGLARFTNAMDIDLRFPGMASATTGTTWHLAIGLIALLTVRQRCRMSRRVRQATTLAIAVVSVGLVGCGSQGGLVALGAIGATLLLTNWRRVRLSPTVLAAVIGVVLVAVVLAATSVIDGFPPEKGFANDIARFDIADDALRAIRDHPLAGPGYTDFELQHGIQPHILPIQLGVIAGVPGVLLGLFATGALLVQTVRAWRATNRGALPGAAFLTAVTLWTLVEPVGPFGSELGVTALFLGVLLAAPAIASRPTTGWDRRPGRSVRRR